MLPSQPVLKCEGVFIFSLRFLPDSDADCCTPPQHHLDSTQEAEGDGLQDDQSVPHGWKSWQRTDRDGLQDELQEDKDLPDKDEAEGRVDDDIVGLEIDRDGLQVAVQDDRDLPDKEVAEELVDDGVAGQEAEGDGLQDEVVSAHDKSVPQGWKSAHDQSVPQGWKLPHDQSVPQGWKYGG